MNSDTAALGARPAPAAGLLNAVGALPRWSILLVAAIAVRALTFGNPVVHVDEEFYFATARLMLDGALPFVDVWDRKPLGLFLLYVPAAALGTPLGIWAYQAMALASVVLTGCMILHLAKRAGWDRGGLAAALLYIFMINFGDGQGGQAPVFYNLIMAAAVALVVPRPGERSGDRGRIHRALGAMALVGVALQIKYSVVFEGMFLGLWLIWREQRLGTTTVHIVRRALALAAVAWVPTLIVGLAYLAIGHGEAWLYANFGSIVARQSDPPMVLLRAFLKVALILGPLLIVGGLSRHVPASQPHEHRVRGLYFGWLVASVLGLLVFGSWFNHYALPVMLPACLCCAGFLGSTALGRRWFAPAMLAMASLGGEYTAWSAMWHRGNAQQLEALAQAIGKGPGCLYVYSGNSILYPYTGRCTVSRWVFPSHLWRERENGALGVDQATEVGRIFASRPEVVVMRRPLEGERMAIRRLARAKLVEGGYRLKGRYPLGDLMIEVFVAQAAPASLAAPSPRRAASSPS